jgi:hypothetical protein
MSQSGDYISYTAQLVLLVQSNEEDYHGMGETNFDGLNSWKVASRRSKIWN